MLGGRNRRSLALLLVLAGAIGAHAQSSNPVVETSQQHLFPGGVRHGPARFVNLGVCSAIGSQDHPDVNNGFERYCSDCTIAPVCAGGCVGGPSICGAEATCVEGVWTCGAGGMGGICTPAAAVPIQQRALANVATTGTCPDNWLPFCDVRNYGAVCDGVTDDTTAIQNAIAGCEVSLGGGGTTCTPGGIVYFHGDTCKVTGTLRACGVSFLGNQATILETANLGLCNGTFCDTDLYNPILDLYPGSGVFPIEVSGVNITGPGLIALTPGVHSTNNADGIHANGELHLRQTAIQQVEDGIRGPFDSSSAQVTQLDNVTVQSVYRAIVNPTSGVWNNVFLTGSRYAAIFLIETATWANLRWYIGQLTQAPYLIAQGLTTDVAGTHVFLSNITIDGVLGGVYGNAGIWSINAANAATSVDTGGAREFVMRGGVTGFLFTQSNTYKIPAIAVDKDIRLGYVNDATFSIVNAVPNCIVQYLAGGLTWLSTGFAGGLQAGNVNPCTITTGFPAFQQTCTRNAGQCFRPLGTLSASGVNQTVIISEATETYSITGAAATTVWGFSIESGTDPLVNEHLRLVFSDGNITLLNNNGGAANRKLLLKGAANVNPAAGNIIDFLYDPAALAWREFSRNF